MQRDLGRGGPLRAGAASSRQRNRSAAGEVPLGDVLGEVLRACGAERNGAVAKISASWTEIVGTAIASHTVVKGYQRGVLGVEVDSAPWLQELAGFRRQEILLRLAEVLPQVRVHDLKFSIRG